MSVVHAPFAGTLEWCVEVGEVVVARQVLGFLSVRDHCAVRPLLSPAAGRLSWRSAAALPEVVAQAVLCVLGDDPAELAHALDAERDEVVRLHARLREALEQVRRRAATTLALRTVAQLEAALARLERLQA